MATDWEVAFHDDLEAALSEQPGHAAPLACEEGRIFRGSLERLPLVQVVRLLHENRKSGVLVLAHGSQEDRIFLRRGEVLAATAGSRRGVAAFYRLLERDVGHFRFEARRVHPARTIYEPTASLLAAGALQSASEAEGAVPVAATALDARAGGRASLISWTVGRAAEIAATAARSFRSARVPTFRQTRFLPAWDRPSGRYDFAIVGAAAALLLSTGLVAALSGHPSTPQQQGQVATASRVDEPAALAALRATNARTQAQLARMERQVLMLSGSIAGSTMPPPPVVRIDDPDRRAAARLSLSPLRLE